jgi:hypothetical protein
MAKWRDDFKKKIEKESKRPIEEEAEVEAPPESPERLRRRERDANVPPGIISTPPRTSRRNANSIVDNIPRITVRNPTINNRENYWISDASEPHTVTEPSEDTETDNPRMGLAQSLGRILREESQVSAEERSQRPEWLGVGRAEIQQEGEYVIPQELEESLIASIREGTPISFTGTFNPEPMFREDEDTNEDIPL